MSAVRTGVRACMDATLLVYTKTIIYLSVGEHGGYLSWRFTAW